MPQGYSGQYSLRRNLVSLSNRELLQEMFVFVLKTKKKLPTPNMHKENAPIPPGGGIPTKLKNWLYLATCCLERLLP